MKYDLELTPEEQSQALKAMRPTGYRLLVAVAKVQEKQGLIYLPDQRKSDEETASILGRVLAIGPDAYADKDRFPCGAYCSVDDVIMMASYTGRRFKINDREYRLINDDNVIAIVNAPEMVERA
jgi:co-chaperonin GroES (HSP10)